MKYQVLFSLTNNEKVFINVVCCSRDWRFKGKDKIFKSSMQMVQSLKKSTLKTLGEMEV